MIDSVAHPSEKTPEPIETKTGNPVVKAVRAFVGRIFSNEKKKEVDTQDVETLTGEMLIAKVMESKKDKEAFDALLKKIFVKLDEGNLPLLHKLHREIRGVDLEDRDLMAIHDQLKIIGNENNIYSFLKSDSRIIENIDELRSAEKADNLAGNTEVELSWILTAYIARFMERQKDPSIVYDTDIKVRLKNDAKAKEFESEIPMDDPEHRVIPINKPHPDLKVVAKQENSDHQVA